VGGTNPTIYVIFEVFAVVKFGLWLRQIFVLWLWTFWNTLNVGGLVP